MMNFPKHFAGGSVFRVGGAIVVGGALVGLAFFAQDRSSADEIANMPALVVARGDVRTVQETQDTDGDGIPNWEEALNGTDPNVYTKRTVSTATPATTTEPYTPPTTLTDKFSQQFLENIIRTSAGEEMTAEDKAKIVNDSVNQLSEQITDTFYTQADIKSVSQNDLASLREYGNALGDTITKNAVQKGSVLTFLGQALQDNNPEELAGLKPIEQTYAGIVKNLLLLETPSSFAQKHIDLITALSLIQSDLAGMQQVFSDPLNSLVRIRRYQDDAKNLIITVNNIRETLEANNIVYTSGEPGIFLCSLQP